jgi:tetratricopeptide (TPR) repeat protein
LQLIRADTDSHLWAESFDRDINDPSLAEEAAKEIAKQSHTATPAAITDQYVNPAAHDAYLRGKYLWFSDKMLESGAYFQKATEIQPDYAAAWAGLADYYGEAVAGDALDPRIALPQEEAAAKRALALGPDLAEAHVAIAAAYLIARWDWVDADRESQRAISLDPSNGEYWYFRACVLSAMNRKADAIEAARKSVELAPYERPTALAEMYSFDRQYDAAIAELRLRLEATPSSEALLYTLSDTWRRKGKDKEALDAWVRMLIASGNDQAVKPVRRAYAQGGWRGFLRWQLHLREQQAKTSYVSPVELANYHAQLGEREPTLTLLEEGYRQRATDMRWLQEDPAYDFLAADPQYRSILQRVGEPAPN